MSLQFLVTPFNSIDKSLKVSYMTKLNKLTKQLEDANEQLKYRDKLKDRFINIVTDEIPNTNQPYLD